MDFVLIEVNDIGVRILVNADEYHDSELSDIIIEKQFNVDTTTLRLVSADAALEYMSKYSKVQNA